MAYNRHVAALVCFGPDVYEEVYQDRIGFPGGCRQALVDNQSAIRAAMDLLQYTRTVPDRFLKDICGVEHPQSEVVT